MEHGRLETRLSSVWRLCKEILEYTNDDDLQQQHSNITIGCFSFPIAAMTEYSTQDFIYWRRSTLFKEQIKVSACYFSGNE